MARASLFKITTDALKDAAGDLGDISAQELTRRSVEALNEVVDRTYDLARERITTGINLDDAYLRRRMSVTHADTSRLQAEIVARGDRPSMTRLASYDARMVIVPRTTRGRSRNTGRLGIPQGSKQSGIDVTVVRGSEKTMGSAFLLRLKQGSEDGNKFGVFIREGKRKKHLYGPSVYQLFRWQAERITDEVADDLETTLIERVQEQLDRII